jgi:hypothetical protein
VALGCLALSGGVEAGRSHPRGSRRELCAILDPTFGENELVGTSTQIYGRV